MQQGSRYLRKLNAHLRNREATVLHHALPYKLNKINIDDGRPPTTDLCHGLFDNLLKNLFTPAKYYLLAHDIQLIDLIKRTMDFNRRMLYAFKNFIIDRTSQAAGEGTRVSISDHFYHATGTRRDLSCD
ncbi:hypothetical protein TNCV_3181701 [Trichonephila clavipes]|nr:hypothetical protein TNCV_3181701 [Trichonephila clavipes]